MLSALLAAALLVPSLTHPSVVHAAPATDTPTLSTLVSTQREAPGLRKDSVAAASNADAGSAVHSDTANSSPSLGPSAGPGTWHQAVGDRARLEAALAASDALVSAPPGSEEAARAAAAAARVMGSGPWAAEGPPVGPLRGKVAAPATAAATAATDSSAGSMVGDTTTGGRAGAGAGAASGVSPLGTSAVMLASGAAILLAVAVAAAVATGAVQVPAAASSAAEGKGGDDRKDGGGGGGSGGGSGSGSGGGGGGGHFEVSSAVSTEAPLAVPVPAPGSNGPEVTAPMAATAATAPGAASTTAGELAVSAPVDVITTSTGTTRQAISDGPTPEGSAGSAAIPAAPASTPTQPSGIATAARPGVDVTALEPTAAANGPAPVDASPASPATSNDVVSYTVVDGGQELSQAASPSPPARPSLTALTGLAAPTTLTPPSPDSAAPAATPTAPATAVSTSARDSTTEGGLTSDMPPAAPGASGLQVMITPSLTPTRPGPFPASAATGSTVKARRAVCTPGTLGRTNAGSQPGRRAGPQAEPQGGPKVGPQTGLKVGPEAGPEAGPEVGSQEEPQAGPLAGPEAGPEVGSQTGPQVGSQEGPQRGPKIEPQSGPQAGPQLEPPGASVDTGAGSSGGESTLAAAMMERILDINKLLDEGVRALEDTSAAAAAAVAAASGKERLAPLQRPRVGSAPAAASAAPAPAPEPEPASAAAAAPAPAPAAPPKAVPLHRPAKPSATEAETPDAHSSPQAPAHPPPAAPTPSATAPQAAPSASSAVSIPKADALAPPPCGSASSASLLRLKSELLDLVYGTSRGVAASAEQQRAIDKVVCALEARNPHAATTDAMSALAGRWTLVYTSSSLTLAVLRVLDQLPLVGVCDLWQLVDPVSLTVTNNIDLAVPLPLSLRAESGLEVRSPRQFKVRVTRVGVDTFLETPQLVAALEIPPSISVLGATLDLTPLQRLVSAAEAPPRRDLPEGAGGCSSGSGCMWMLTTYLDDTLRISRDDEARVFVMLNDAGFGRGPDNKP